VARCQGERQTGVTADILNIEERVTLPDAPNLRKDLPISSREQIDELVPLLYQELREIAHRHLAGRRNGATLNTTALINEAYLKLVDQAHAKWNDRAHFLGVAALAMRHILVDRAKARMSGKRGGGQFRVTLDDNVLGAQDAPDALLQITDSLDRLAVIDARLSRIVEYRFFGGLTNAEIATVLGITERTVERDWIKARMLLRELLAS
jgi:RNA polymerase sigma factor (TIGR02999 family)